MSLSLVLTLTAAQGHAFQGDCGQPITFGANPAASDALGVLRAAVGSFDCQLCTCDVDTGGAINASDALRTLRFAVGSLASLDCLACSTDQNIGTAGGVFRSSDRRFSLDIPAGALSETTTLTIEGVDPSTLPGILASAERAYALGPEDVQFNTPAELDVVLQDGATPAAGVIGAKLALLVSLEGDQTEVLDVQQLFIDGDTDRATAGAILSHFSIIAVMRADVLYSVDGVPEEAAVGDSHNLDVSVVEDAGEDLVAIQSASYTDNDFDAWQPAEGDIVSEPLLAGPPGTFAESFPYECASAASDDYRTQIASILDVTADVGGSPSDVPHVTVFEKSLLCEQP